MGKKDEELIADVQAGDPVALEELFMRYKISILNYALRMLKVRADAEDITAEVFLVLSSRSQTYQPVAKFSTWIYTIARNLCVSRLRKRNRFVSLWFKKDGEGELVAFDVPDPNAHDGQGHDQKDMAVYVQRAIAKLPLKQKEIVILREYQNLSYEEISQVLAISLAQVKILIFRARERLRVDLDPLIKEASDV